MNNLVLNAILRYGVTYLGALLTAHGVGSSTVETVGGVIMAVVPAAIGALSSTKASQVKAVQSHGMTVLPAQVGNPAMDHAAGNNS